MLGLAIVHDRLVVKPHVSLQICVLQTRVLLTKKSPIFANGGFSTLNCPTRRLKRQPFPRATSLTSFATTLDTLAAIDNGSWSLPPL
jgi:hypothetical protein